MAKGQTKAELVAMGDRKYTCPICRQKIKGYKPFRAHVDRHIGR
jgi:hypothetical protein